jgi:hypothetical protein
MQNQHQNCHQRNLILEARDVLERAWEQRKNELENSVSVLA